MSDNPVTRNALWMLLGQGLRLLVQVAYFILIARGLGAEQFGAFVGVVSLVAILAPFAAIGSGNLLIKNVSRDRTLLAECWGNALFMAFTSGALLTVIVVALSRMILPGSIPGLLVFLVAASDLLFAVLLGVAGQAFQAMEKLGKTAVLNLLLSVLRLVAALLLVRLVDTPDSLAWAGFYLLSTAASSLIAVGLVHCRLVHPKFAPARIKAELIEGSYFAVGLSAQSIYNDIDKTMLTRLATLSAAGVYAAAYRLIDVAFIPVGSLLSAAYPEFFRRGARGISHAAEWARALMPRATVYGLLVGVALLAMSPIVPLILGPEYTAASEALRWLAPLPLLKALHYFAADTLTGSGFQGLRSAVQVAVAVVNVLLNLWLIPLYSWRGAAWASLASDSLLLVTLWATVAFIVARSAHPMPFADPGCGRCGDHWQT